MLDTVHPAAQDLVGIPFIEGGRDFRRNGGADCLGLVLAFLASIGYEAADPWDQVADEWRSRHELTVGDRMPAGWKEAGEWTEIGDVGETAGGRHVCVYVGGGYVLHTRRRASSFLRTLQGSKVSRWWRWCG